MEFRSIAGTLDTLCRAFLDPHHNWHHLQLGFARARMGEHGISDGSVTDGGVGSIDDALSTSGTDHAGLQRANRSLSVALTHTLDVPD